MDRGRRRLRAATAQAGDRLDFGNGDEVEVAEIGSRRVRLRMHGSWDGVCEWIHEDQTLKVQHLCSVRLVRTEGRTAMLEVSASHPFRRRPPDDPSAFAREPPGSPKHKTGLGGLTFCRRVGETVRIGSDVTLTVTEIRRGDVRLTFHAPRSVVIDRGEMPPRGGHLPRHGG